MHKETETCQNETQIGENIQMCDVSCIAAVSGQNADNFVDTGEREARRELTAQDKDKE